jgi:nucleoid-associated protein YgaU
VIYSDSRYADGSIVKLYDVRRADYEVTVLRNFPEQSGGFRYYTWVEGDRIELIAHRTLGNANNWSRIMDFNPEVIDAFSIPVGTVLRIPNVQ